MTTTNSQLIQDLQPLLGHDPRVYEGAEPFVLDNGMFGDDTHSLILIHGWGGSPQSWRMIAEQIAPTGIRVVVPRMAGNATDPADMADAGALDWIDHLGVLINRLAEAGPVSIGGCSLGAMLSIVAAGLYNDKIRTLMPVNGGVKIGRPEMTAAALLGDEGLALSIEDVGPMTLDPDAFEISYNQAPLPRVSMIQTNAIASLARELAPRVTAPTLLMHSRQDYVLPFENAALIEELLTGAEVTVLPLEYSYHAAQVDFDAPVIGQAMIDFLAKAGGPIA